MSVYEAALRSPVVYLTRSQRLRTPFSDVLSKGRNSLIQRPVTGRLYAQSICAHCGVPYH